MTRRGFFGALSALVVAAEAKPVPFAEPARIDTYASDFFMRGATPGFMVPSEARSRYLSWTVAADDVHVYTYHTMRGSGHHVDS
jgi:hypothetical protein